MAQDWVVAGNGSEVATGFDQANIFRDGAQRSGWAILVRRTTRPAFESIPAHDYTISRVVWNCVEATARTVQSQSFRLGVGTPVAVDLDGSTYAVPVAPGSVGAELLEAVCSGVPRQSLRMKSPHEFATAARQFLGRP